MTLRIFSHLRPLAASAALALGSLCLAPTQALASSTSGITVTVAPKAGYEQVSLSRSGATFYATYQVTVTSAVALPRIRLYGVAKALDATDVVLSAAPLSNSVPDGTCSTFGFHEWGVKCRLDAPQNTVVGSQYVSNFEVQFQSPTAGAKLRFKWSTANARLASEFDSEGEHEEDDEPNRTVNGTGGTSDITLITQDTVSITNGFKTIVPVGGGVFFTGYEVPWTDNANPKPQGGVATKNDPFTTTVVVPPITAATTADSAEAQVCGSSFIGASCFQSDLTIPNVTLQDPNGHLTIYLRVDVTRLAFRASISQAIINYAHVIGNTPLPLSACTVAGPSPGVPCIKARKVYPATTSTPVDWRGDWEFEIWAKDNGRFLF